jgi:hypothetical protein
MRVVVVSVKTPPRNVFEVKNVPSLTGVPVSTIDAATAAWPNATSPTANAAWITRLYITDFPSSVPTDLLLAMGTVQKVYQLDHGAAVQRVRAPQRQERVAKGGMTVRNADAELAALGKWW